jgi:hypothetical protein
LPILTKPWDSIGMDFIGPFPESKGFNYLWVIIEHGAPHPRIHEDEGI